MARAGVKDSCDTFLILQVSPQFNCPAGFQSPQHIHLSIWRPIRRRGEADEHAVLHEQGALQLLVEQQDSGRLR